VTIDPSAGLTSGQVVHVTGSGFSPNESLVINECADKGAKTGPADCALGALTPTRTDAGGKVVADFTVTIGPFGINKIVCSASQPCLLSVSQASLSPTEEADVRLNFG
jgi:Neocarzinostatin family